MEVPTTYPIPIWKPKVTECAGYEFVCRTMTINKRDGYAIEYSTEYAWVTAYETMFTC